MRNVLSSGPGQRLLSRTAEHALRATLYLGRFRGAGFIPAAQVAAALGMPPNYTSKTLRQLARRGLVRSLRGPHGGFALQVEPSELSVAQLLDAVDDVASTDPVCLLGDRPCNADAPCAAHRRWAKAQRRAAEALGRTTLADLLGDDTNRSTP
jgi:Rrf2 family protein